MHHRPDLMNIEDATDGAPEEELEPVGPPICGECGGELVSLGRHPSDPDRLAPKCERCGLVYPP